MNYTNNYNLKKPSESDFYKVSDFNENADTIDNALKTISNSIPTSLPASDVYAWAKAPNKPTYTASEVGARASTWTPTKSDIGLGNVDNTADSAKSVNYATTAGSVTGSAKVVISDTAPSDTTAVWIK